MPQPRTIDSSQNFRRIFLILALLFFTVGSDQATKAFARNTLSMQSLSYLGDCIRIQHLENPGAFLSFGAGLRHENRFWIFTIGVAIFVFATFCYLLAKTTLDKWTTISLTLVVGGGFGNLIDRAMKGTVTDFLNVGIGQLRTGVFNIADMAIMAGVFIFLISSVKTPPDAQTGDPQHEKS
jgi:signal peptidase II